MVKLNVTIMKKKSLKIADLKIKSFVTSMNDETAKTVKGAGSFFDDCETMGPQPMICQNTVFPDQSICNPACFTNIPELCQTNIPQFCNA